MECPDAQLLMAACLSDEVAPVQRREIEGHLAVCAGCRDELASFREAWDRLGRWPVPTLDLRVERELLARVKGEAFEMAQRVRPLAAAAAALVGVVLSIGISLILPYERASQACRDALGGFGLLTGVSDSPVFFLAGLFYGLIPLLLVGVISSRLMSGGPVLLQGTATSVAFALLITPYVLIACSALPGTITAAILAGVTVGGLSGGLGGFWAGGRTWRPAH